MIKILYILPSINKANGVNKFVFNYVKFMDKDIFQCEVLVPHSRTDDFSKEYEKIGIKVHFLPKISELNYFNLKKQIFNFFKLNHYYDIVHCNVVNIGYYYLKYAKVFGIKVRILHSHSSMSSDKLISKFRNFIISPFSIKNATNFVACSNIAGKYLFKNKKFELIENAMDVTKYTYSELNKEFVLNKYPTLQNKKIIGFVGRLSRQKNPFFMIKIAQKLIKKNIKFIFLVVGTGVLEKKIKEEINKYNLNEYFMLLGEVNDASIFYSCMNCFILPSLYEGLPLVAIEAQLSGIPSILSKNISEEVIIGDHIKLLDIKNIDSWISNIEKSFNETIKTPSYSKKYDIRFAVIKLQDYYLKIVK